MISNQFEQLKDLLMFIGDHIGKVRITDDVRIHEPEASWKNRADFFQFVDELAKWLFGHLDSCPCLAP